MSNLHPHTRDLEQVLELTFDNIHIVEPSGLTSYISASCLELFGLTQEEIVGRDVHQLEREGAFTPSVAVLAFRERKRVTTFQTTASGKRLLVTGIPVLDAAGKLERIYVLTRDTSMVQQMEEQLQEAQELIGHYQSELARLQSSTAPLASVVGASACMRELLLQAQQLAAVDATVLLLGETGTGKSMVARFVHEMSPRSQGPFVTVHCGAITESLFESEVFGYRKGSFTGANREGKVGLVKAAEGGTLFLDEIADISQPVQVKLLRLIQDKIYLPVGSVAEERANIRIVAATNRNLQEMVRQGLYRADLYYRLHVVPLHIPPLRERPEDMAPLAQAVTRRLNQRYGVGKRLSSEVLNALALHQWPGNVRELENLLERLVVTVRGPVIQLADLPAEFSGTTPDARIPHKLPAAVADLERKLLSEALRQYRTTREIAAALGINQSTVVRKLQAHGLSPGRPEAPDAGPHQLDA